MSAPKGKKKKLEVVDVEPYDLCNLASGVSKFPGVNSDQEMKEKMEDEEEEPKVSN